MAIIYCEAGGAQRALADIKATGFWDVVRVCSKGMTVWNLIMVRRGLMGDNDFLSRENAIEVRTLLKLLNKLKVDKGYLDQMPLVAAKGLGLPSHFAQYLLEHPEVLEAKDAND
jgi:hypothetical protein